ncbi:MAG TPA: tetratricopeptide repeat protein, partial [Candidatus Binataceae bacterium]|nr:tetratricopeptide repeat protein [Candidatus Binataceae bacterium]
KLGRPQEAEELFRRALAVYRQLAEHDPKTAVYHLRQGQGYTELLRVLWSRGRDDEAARLMEDAVDTLSNTAREHGNVPAARDSLARFHHDLANLQRQRAQNDDALKNYTQAAAIWGKLADDVPGEPAYRGHQGYVLTYSLPSLLVATGRHAEARAHWQRALETLPKSAEAHNNLAWLLATCPDETLRDPRRAVELASKAVELEPAQGTYRNTLGVAHYRAGDWPAAIEALNKSMERRQRGDAFDWFFLAMAEWQRGNKDEARKWYDKAVDWAEKNARDNEELKRFSAEATALLGVKDE